LASKKPNGLHRLMFAAFYIFQENQILQKREVNNETFFTSLRSCF